jgi:hypothetical protein
VSVTKAGQLMLLKEDIDVCCGDHKKPKHIVWAKCRNCENHSRECIELLLCCEGLLYQLALTDNFQTSLQYMSKNTGKSMRINVNTYKDI